MKKTKIKFRPVPLKLVLILLVCTMIDKSFSFAANTNYSPAAKKQAKEWIKTQPVQFIENKGQMTDMNHRPVPFVLYKAEAPGMDVYITEKGLTYVFFKAEEEEEEKETRYHISGKPIKNDTGENRKIEWNRIEMSLLGASIKKENIITDGASTNFSKYFLPHCPNGITEVHSFRKLIIKNIYPNIDWILYNSGQQGFKYDFVVHPGADYKQLELIYASLHPLKLNDAGDILIKTEIGTLTENAPTSFLNGKEIASEFVKNLNQKNKQGGYDTHIQFNIPDATPSAANGDLVIDPQLTWATFFGGTGAEGTMSTCTDLAGNVFITGYTIASADFPTLDAGTFFQGTALCLVTCFISKFSSASALLWSVYYGGSGSEVTNSIITDISGNVYIAGFTSSADFPIQDEGTFFQGTLGGGMFDAFILKFDNSGNRLWATFYGGTGDDFGYSLASDVSGNLFVTGSTASDDFPTQDAGTFFQGTHSGDDDLFFLKFDNSGNRLWATYYGGTELDGVTSIITDADKNLFVTGYTASTDFPTLDAGTFFQAANAGSYDAFILKFNNVGARILSTYYGGTTLDIGQSIITDANGNVFVTGPTFSADFPTQDAGTFFQGALAGASDVFILKFDNACNRLWATYYGGDGNDIFSTSGNIGIDGCGSVYIGFDTDSETIPVQPSCDNGYYDSTYNGSGDIFIIKFSNKGNLLWASYLGGDGYDFRSTLAMDLNDNLFISGEWIGATLTTSYPVTDPGDGAYYDDLYNGEDDIYMVKFTNIQPGSPVISTTTGCSCTSTATVTPGSTCPYTYLWSNGESTQTATGLCPGVYTVTVNDSTMCNSGTASVTITGLLPPIAGFSMSPTENILENTSVFFTNQSTGATGVSWNFNDPASGIQDTSTILSPTHTFATEGTYCVQLIVNGNNGCSDTVSGCVIVVKDIQLPNIFTPNGDTKNDAFYIKNLQLGVATLNIYNRWGKLIFTSQGYNNDWNGNGVSDGVYYYTMYYPINEKTYTGFVQLLR